MIINGRTLPNVGLYPTLFLVAYYDEPERYHDGLAGSIGYWAENRIPGGVTLFYKELPSSDV